MLIKNENAPHPVGEKKPNELGFYDMSGNLWEWCLDRVDWPEGDVIDPHFKGGTDPCSVSGTQIIIRGGCFFLDKRYCFPMARFCVTNIASPNVGFRIALVPQR